MKFCESKKEAIELARKCCETHNKEFPNDQWTIQDESCGKEIWVINKFGDPLRIYQW